MVVGVVEGQQCRTQDQQTKSDHRNEVWCQPHWVKLGGWVDERMIG